MKGIDRVRLIGWWLLAGPLVVGAVAGICWLAYALATDPSVPRSMASITVVLLGGGACAVFGWVFWALLRQETRAVFRDARERAGGCPACGYSLRGNISGVCPECGTPIKQD